MSYIRMGEKLPSGKASRFYVFGSTNSLVNIYEDFSVPYPEIRT